MSPDEGNRDKAEAQARAASKEIGKQKFKRKSPVETKEASK